MNNSYFIISLLLIFILLIITIVLSIKSILSKKKYRALDLTYQAKEQYFYQLSHDLRTPMNGILGMIQIIEDSNNISDYIEALDDIKSSGSYMMSLLNNVLDLSKITDKSFTLNLQPYDFKELERLINVIILPKATEKNITLTIENNLPNNCFVLVDNLRLEQIVLNLLSNAIKFTNSDGNVHFKVNYKNYNDKQLDLYLNICDNGVGMTEDFVKNCLFKEFKRDSFNSSHTNGTGLGLSIVKKLVERMSGNIECKSILNEGSTFTVTLPLKLYNEQ